jgi:methionine-S-sulfoxide reductase
VTHKLSTLLLLVTIMACNGTEPSSPSPSKQPVSTTGPSGEATAVFAGGCFWCTEAVFQELDGVSDVVSGYAGGDEATAIYTLVSSGATDHAEAVRITYDPAKVDYEQLLEIFFISHDPTQLNRQGPDTGRHYRSAIFYADEAQKAAAKAFIGKLDAEGQYGSPIVTTLEPLEGFYEAEDYHQDFADKNPNHPYIRINAAPKVEKVKKMQD